VRKKSHLPTTRSCCVRRTSSSLKTRDWGLKTGRMSSNTPFLLLQKNQQPRNERRQFDGSPLTHIHNAVTTHNTTNNGAARSCRFYLNAPIFSREQQL
jgi:hypothetical protein